MLAGCHVPHLKFKRSFSVAGLSFWRAASTRRLHAVMFFLMQRKAAAFIQVRPKSLSRKEFGCWRTPKVLEFLKFGKFKTTSLLTFEF